MRGIGTRRDGTVIPHGAAKWFALPGGRRCDGVMPQHPKVVCLTCLTAFPNGPEKVDGYLWCGCGQPDLVYLRPVKGPQR